MGVFENALIEGKELLQYIPQREPVVMVDKFFGIEGPDSFSALTVCENNLFCMDGYFQETGIIEHIAQSAALRVGYECQTAGKPVPLGFIGSVNKCTIYHLPPCGSELNTTISVLTEMMNITLIAARVAWGTRLLAECQMKIFLQKEAENE